MSDAILVALITGGLSLIGSLVAQRRQTSLTIYRIDELEGKVSKHNNLIERMALVERDVKTVFSAIEELKEERADEY